MSPSSEEDDTRSSYLQTCRYEDLHVFIVGRGSECSGCRSTGRLGVQLEATTEARHDGRTRDPRLFHLTSYCTGAEKGTRTSADIFAKAAGDW